ncbi:ABC transporter permease [Thalassobacillus sp. CUG 92003]|uniref:ABC transporter permease n=1 Tax=Thalassobacillus sp. CUG 92003 TaxID=2736641 RepID=UPI0015E6F7AE|nr:ABC transporter permease subunit [Thalassobacillus sp. CUG 92003]
MSNFLQLIRNEQMKSYSQISNWILYGILALLVIAMAVFIKIEGQMTDGSETGEGGDWRQELQAENEQLEQQAEEAPSFAASNEEQIAMNQYRLDNDIEPRGYDVWSFLQENRTNTAVISLFTIIVAAGILANEFKWGTIKLLLIRPISRTKILFAKYASVLVFALTMLVFLMVLAFLTGSAFFGIESASEPYLYFKDGSVHETSILQHTLLQYLLGSVNLVMMATFAFMISAVFRNSALAIGVAIFLMFAGNSIVAFLSRFDWAKYILFANTDLNQHLSGNPMFEGTSLGFSLGVLAVYFVIFLCLAWAVFTKRDVASA